MAMEDPAESQFKSPEELQEHIEGQLRRVIKVRDSMPRPRAVSQAEVFHHRVLSKCRLILAFIGFALALHCLWLCYSDSTIKTLVAMLTISSGVLLLVTCLAELAKGAGRDVQTQLVQGETTYRTHAFV